MMPDTVVPAINILIECLKCRPILCRSCTQHIDRVLEMTSDTLTNAGKHIMSNVACARRHQYSKLLLTRNTLLCLALKRARERERERDVLFPQNNICHATSCAKIAHERSVRSQHASSHQWTLGFLWRISLSRFSTRLLSYPTGSNFFSSSS